MSQGHGHKVAILSSVHLALDNRVFYREARTLARAGDDVALSAVHSLDEGRDGVLLVAQIPQHLMAGPGTFIANT